MDHLVVISEDTNGKLILDPQTVGGPSNPLRIGDTITWRSTLDITCQIGSFYPVQCAFPGTLTIGASEYARIFVMAMPSDAENITYWCTPTAPQSTQPGTRQATDSYDPGQGIIIVDPPLPDDDDHKDKHKHKREKQEREVVTR